MVNDGDDIRLFQSRNSLDQYVMINQDDLFPTGTDQMIT